MNKIYLMGTGSYAKERLNVILASDRIGCSPDFIGTMKNSISRLMDRYTSVDESDIEIQVKERMLVAYVPLVNARKNNKDKNVNTITEQGTDNYDSDEEGITELKTVQS